MRQDDALTASVTDNERYRLLVDAITDYAIYMLDPAGRVVSWNAGAARFKGYAEPEIIGEHFSRFYTDEDRRAGLPERALATAERGGAFEGKGWRLRKDGTRFWAHVVIDAIRDADGRLMGYAKITRDLTERKHAEEILRRSQEQFRMLVQGVTDYAIYMLDPEGHVSSWNEGAQRIKGYMPEDIMGEHFSVFYTDEDRAENLPQRALGIAAREGRYEQEGWRVRKDGSRFWVNAVIDRILDEDGRIMGYAKVTRDVTESRDAQRALEKTREALFQSQKLEAIGQLTGGIAHDFNNLLMAVMGSLELVRKRLPQDPRIVPLVDNAIHAAQRGSELTRRMLAFARRQELEPVAVAVPTLVRGMTDLLQRSIGPLNVIETRFPLALTSAMADTNQLEMALLNLVLNARDAMPGGGTIVISAREDTVGPDNARRLPAGCYVCLSVQDTGEGMDAETLTRATEPFFTTKGVGKGTGLGLSMVHGVAEQSGGRLFLKSQPGVGTTVELWLPAATDSPGGDVQQRDERPERNGAPLVVLIVDDDALVLMNTVAMLEDLGHVVHSASSGQRALDILRQTPSIDLVITDQAMPHMTGAQLIRAIRAERTDLPVIIATGYAELPPDFDGDFVKLSKPFNQADLMRTIASSLKRGAAQHRS